MLIRLPRLSRLRRRSASRHCVSAEYRSPCSGSERLEDRLLLSGDTIGVLQYDVGQAFEGYNLLHPSASRTTYLLDMEGRVVHSWVSSFTTGANYLLDDGSLLRTAVLPNTSQTMNAGGGTGRLERFDWDGNLIWEFELNEFKGTDGNMRLHHDVHVLPNGNILAIAWEYLTDETAIALGRDPAVFDSPSEGVWPDVILEIQPDLQSGTGGDIVWSWHAKDHLIQDVDPTRENFGVVEDHPELIDFNYVVTGVGATSKLADWNHANAIHYDARLDQIVLSVRSQSELWVIDHSTTTEEAASHSGGNSGRGGDLLYRWGNEAAYRAGTRDDQQLFFQHDTQFIQAGLDGAGNFLMFNNGWARPDGSSFSSIDEIVPPRINEQFHLALQMDGSAGDVLAFGTNPAPPDWQPVSGDWDGDGIESTGVFDPSTGTFRMYHDNAEGDDSLVTWTSPLSGAGLLAIAGDWNGDGFDTPGVFDPAQATFTLFNTTDGSGGIALTLDGAPSGSVIPVAGDWNGDGFDSVGLYDVAGTEFLYSDILARTSVAAWDSLNRTDVDSGWVVVAGDWNGDGADSIGWYDSSSTTFHYGDDLTSASETLTAYAVSGAESEWRPITGDWNSNDRSTLGLYDPDFGNYELGTDGTYGPADLEWTYDEGPMGDFFSPIVSGVQRLPNGNTLIAEGALGRAFEVTSDGDIVWEYVNPVDLGDHILHQGDEAGDLPGFVRAGVRSNIIFRMNRYAPDHPAFDGRDLTPGSVLERTDPNVVVAVDMQGRLTVTDIIQGGSANTVTMTFDSMTDEYVVTSPRHDLGDGSNPSTTEIRVPAASVTGGIQVDLGGDDDFLDASALAVAVSVQGGDGNDVINGGMAADTIDGGSGDDLLAGLAGDDVLTGGDGNDIIRGSGGRDQIAGGAGDDLLRGQGGHDELSGGAGIDRLEGGGGTTAVEDELAGHVLIDGQGYLSDRGDRAEVVARSYVLTGSGQADRIDASASSVAVFVQGGDGDDTLIGSDFDDVLLGGKGDDIIDGRGGDELLLAGDDGNDVIRGGDGNDRLVGHAGDDTLLGSAGSDSLVGGSGDDLLLGEAGTDRVRGNGGNDRVTGAGNGTMLEDDMEIADGMDTVDEAFAYDFDALMV